MQQFNRIIYDISRNIRNLCFFDSHHFAAKTYRDNLNIPFFYVRGRKGGLNELSVEDEQSNNGIHITLQMRRLISDELVRSVGFLTGARGARFRDCKWMRNVATRSV